MYRAALLTLLLSSICVAQQADPIDRLFHVDPAIRKAAREELLRRKDTLLPKLLERIEQRVAAGVKRNSTLHVYAVRDLTIDKQVWADALVRVKALDAIVREQPNGVLVVYADQAGHTRVAAILTEVRRRASRTIELDTHLLVLPRTVKLPATIERKNFVAWAREQGSKINSMPVLRGRNGQPLEITTMRQISYVADFDVEVAQGTFIADPIVDTVPIGISIEVTPVIDAPGKSISLSLDVRFDHLRLPMKEAQRSLPGGRNTKVQQPETRTTRVRTVRTLEPGQLAVIDLGVDTEGRRHVLFADARARPPAR